MHRKHSHCLPIIWLLLSPLLAHAAGYYGDGGYVDGDVSLRYESNLSRANQQRDIEEDMVTALSAGAGYLKNLNEKSQLLISAYLAHERFAEFKDLNNIEANATLVYTIQPQAGYTQPWFTVKGKVSRWQFNKSAIRDSTLLAVGVGAGKRLNDKVIAQLDYDYEHRISERKVFDTDVHNLKAQLVYSHTPAVSLFGNYNLQYGEVVSTATPNASIIAAANRVAPDDVFTPGLGPGCMNRRCAYQLDALGHFFEAGMEWNLNQTFTFDTSGRYFIVDGDGLEAYKGWIYRVGLYMQF